MKPSLSVRTAEHPRRKDRVLMDLSRLATAAREQGFEALCLRRNAGAWPGALQAHRLRAGAAC